MVLIALVACNGGTWVDTCCLVTNVRNFPNERGVVVGVLKCFVGLCASIYTGIKPNHYHGLALPGINKRTGLCA